MNLAIGIALLTLAGPGTGQDGGDRGAFLDDLAEVHAAMQSRRWPKARASLFDLLEEHAGRAYVLARATELEGDLLRCAFWDDYDEPAPRDVVQGKLLSYNARSGKIKLRYDSLPGDFEVPTRLQVAADSPQRAVLGSELFVHPAHFSGPYTLEVQGSMGALYGSHTPTTYAYADTGESYAVVFGHERIQHGQQIVRVPGAIVALGTGQRLAEKDPSPLEFHEDYSIKMRVTAKSIAGYHDGKKFLEAKKPESDHGSVAFDGCDNVERVLISGEVDPGWIDGLVNARVETAWRAFRERPNARDLLPAWLREALARSQPEQILPYHPEPDAPGHAELAAELAEYLESDADQGERGLAHLHGLADDACTEAFRAWYACLFHLDGYDYEHAREECLRVLAAQPDFARARYRLAECLVGLGNRSEAILELESLLETPPLQPEACVLLARLLMLDGEHDAAQDVLERAVAASVPPSLLAEPMTALARVRRGPEWRRRYEYRSKHYSVYSDISQTMCTKTANLLEESLRIYQDQVRRLPPEARGGPRFDVYLFSGQEGYEAYTQDLWGEPAKNTAGVYSPVLKQLLIWNLPSRDAMLRTVRHEGFHQYVDQLIEGAMPMWLNEGLAEYFETAGIEGGHAVDGELLKQHVEMLKDAEWAPLDELVTMDRRKFYARPKLTYGQAWVTVHYLMRGGAGPREMLDGVFEALLAGASPDTASARLFAKEPASRIEERIRKYHREM